MSKKKLITELTADMRDFMILEAVVKDDFCHYKFQVTSGVGMGDQHQVKGKGMVKDTLLKAMSDLNVHLATIDDVFVISGVDGEFDDLLNHDYTFKYSVNGFKIKGDGVVLVGTKYVSAGGRISFETPKIAFDDASHYKWSNELSKAVHAAAEEVALYKEGNYVPVEDDSVSDDPNQLKVAFSVPEEDMSDFENAKV